MSLHKAFQRSNAGHEYGGGAYFVHRDTVFFTNFTDQRLYRQEPGGEPQADHAGTSGAREHALCRRPRYTGRPDDRLCSRTSRIGARSHQRDRYIARRWIERATESFFRDIDFYSFPRISPDGRRIAWTCWRHPQMPWDGYRILGRRPER